MNVFRRASLAVLIGSLPAALPAEDLAVELKPGAGREVVLQNCLACHGLDYIAMNGGIQGRAGWEATTRKMIDVMKAPISSEDARRIVAYLAEAYGNGT
jgi:mono/diheme cytochrome c family protein